MKKQIVILASGGGSNARSIIQYFIGDREVNVAAILSDRSTAGVHDVAEQFDIPSFSYNKQERSAGEMVEKLNEIDPDLIVLAGYLLLIPKVLTDKFEGRIVNIHPSLLPKYGGKGMFGMNVHNAVYENKETESGMTIHFVNSEFDDGEVILKVACDISDAESADEVQQRVLVLEHKYYPIEIEKLLNR